MRCHLRLVARRVDLEPARPQEDLTRALFVAVARRVGDDIERAVSPYTLDRLLRLPAKELSILLPEPDVMLAEPLEELTPASGDAR